MWIRYTLYDFRVIAHYLGVLILFSAVALAIPFITGLVLQEWDAAARYLLAMGIALVVGGSLRMLRIDPGRLTRQQALAVTGFAWMVLSLIGAIPLYMSGHFPDYYDALFDAVSGFSATGLSIIDDLDHLSNADNMWRFVMHFCGGLGLVVVALSLGIFGKVADSSLYASEGRSEHVVPNVVQTARFISKFSIGIILVAAFIMFFFIWASGMEPVRAALHSFWLAISGFMTAGFAPMSTSVMYYHSAALETILCVLMLVGGINFGLYSEIWKGRTTTFFKDLEVRTGVIWILSMAVIFVAAMCATNLFSNLSDLLRRGCFMFISAATTTGFITVTPNQLATVFPSGALLVLAVTMAVGASSGSTSGGIKLGRIGLIAKSMADTVKSAISPDSARIVTSYNHVGRRVLEPELVKEAMTIFTLFVVTYMVGALVGIAYGYEPVAAIFESVAAASNGGISAGICSTSMPVPLETVYIFEMWAGRLEFVTFIALVIKIAVSLKPNLHRRQS